MRPSPTQPVDPRGQQRADQASGGAEAHGEAEVALVEVELAEREQDEQGPGHRGEEVARRGARRDPPQQRVAEHEGQPLADLLEQRSPVLPSRGSVDVGDAPHEEGRAEEAQRVEGDRQRGAEHADQATGHRGATDLRDRLRGLQLGVALADVRAGHDVGQVALVGDVEEDGADADDQHHGVHLDEREHVEGPRHRKRGEREPADEVVADQHPLLAPPVDPGAGGQPDHEEGQELEGAEQPHLEGVGVQHPDGQHRDGEHRQLGAELADRVADPELPEVVVPEQPAAAAGGGGGGRDRGAGRRARGQGWFCGHRSILSHWLGIINE